MITVHRGAGMLAPGFGLLFALVANVLTFRIFGDSYYDEHKWPKFSVLFMAGIACLAVGTLIKRKRERDAYLEQQAINSLSQKHEIANAIAFSGPRDHLMFIPLQYWSIIYFGAAIIYVVLGVFASPLSVNHRDSLPSVSNTRSDPVQNADDEQMARQVKDVVVTYCKDPRRLVNAKEAIAAMAAVVGERCLDAAGEIPVRTHDLIPGQRAFSDHVNVLLAGDESTELAAIPADSIFGTIRDRLAGSRFQNHFPDLGGVFRNFAGGIGKPEDWGKVPLSLPQEYWPEKLPLRVAFDTRQNVDAVVQSVDKKRRLHVCTLAMIMMLKDESLANQLGPADALTLTFETINGMAKTVPMKDKAIDNPSKAMREAQRQVLRIEPR